MWTTDSTVAAKKNAPSAGVPIKKLPIPIKIPKSIPFRALWERLGWLEAAGNPLRIIGLDIGLTSIRTATVIRKGDQFELEKIQYFSLGDEPLKSLEAELQRVFREKPPENTRVHAAISGASTLVRYISLPRMSEKELHTSMSYEAEKYIPYHISEVVLDCFLLGDGQDERGKKLTKGILAVCKKDVVNSLCDACRAVSAPLAVIDAPPLAVINAFQFNKPESKEHVVALLHIGYNASNLSILLKGEPVFTREISYGGTDLTQAITKHTGLKAEEVEKRKREFKWEHDSELQPVFEESLRFLAQEIRLSFNYFENHVPGAETPEKLYLSGASAQLDHLHEVLQNELDTPTELWSPVEKITVGPGVDRNDLEKYKAGFVISIGLAIRSSN